MSDDLVSLVIEETTEKMHAAVVHARKGFASIRTGRATPALVEKMPIDYYGSEVPLQQLAGFTVPDARTLLISPYDKGALSAIEKAIQASDLGLNPSNDGTVLRLNFPQLTEDRRKDFVKIVKGMAEDGKIKIRNARRAARHELETLQKNGDLTEDELSRAEKDLDKLTHAQEAEIDTALDQKEKELLEV